MLIVDDNATNRLILRKTLEAWQIAAKELADGPGALRELELAALRGEPYDVLLVDGQMPQMDGFRLTRRIRQNAHRRQPIIIMVTSSGLKSDIQRCKELGIAGYLVKPVKRKELLQTLRRIAGQTLTPPTEVHAVVPSIRTDSVVRVLLVEDNRTNQLMAQRMLEKVGYRVVVASDGKEALADIQQQTFDVVLMDVQMPEMDGLEATRQIRKLSHPMCVIPVIAMTASAMAEDRAVCLEAGMDDYVSKPFNPVELVSKIERWTDPQRV